MQTDTLEIRDNILMALLPALPFDGWQWQTIEQAAVEAGYEPAMAIAVFPARLGDAAAHFSDWADRQMLTALAQTDMEDMRVRDRIRLCVLTRLEILTPYKEAVRLAAGYWALPPRGMRAGKIMWRTADRIWLQAGDSATDYNRYTKRALLCGVLGSTLLAWLDDDSPDMEQTTSFLDRRIENVMQLGRILGKIKKPNKKKAA